jgi:hypothetical protein
LSGANGLAAAAQTTAQKALSVPVSGYFKPPSLSNYLNYVINMGIGISQNAYNYYGLLLDLMI